MFYFRLKVRLPFGKARQKTRLRINREVSRLKRHEKKLQLQLKYMQQNVWKLQKKLQRKSPARKPKSTDEAPTPSTPVKEAEALMRSDGLTPRKQSKVMRQLKIPIPKTMNLHAVVAHQGREDILWVQPQDIVRMISPPTAKGRSMRSFLLGEGDMILFGEGN